ncbi:MAG: LON peptidase substrate-binding domain-containing protein [Gemmataceae bacterium]
MNLDSSPLDDFNGIARVFPLPNLVLFPNLMQPLHIFEPRYRQMTREALDTDRLIAMALLGPDWEEEYTNTPDIHQIICVCSIVHSRELEDGRYDILVRGLQRARVLEELETEKLYRMFRAELLEEESAPATLDTETLQNEMLSLLPRWFPDQPDMITQFQDLTKNNIPFATFCDIFGFALPFPVEFKQELLGQLDVSARANQLLTKLRSRGVSRPFPPDFSNN